MMSKSTTEPKRESDEDCSGPISARFFRDMDGDIGEQIEVTHLINPMGEIWRKLKYRNGKTSWMPDRILTEIHTYNKDA